MRFNPRQADLVTQFLIKIIEELSLNSADIAVITYYRANLAAIRKRFREEERTTDSMTLRKSRLAVITCYRANLAAIRKRFREDNRLKKSPGTPCARHNLKYAFILIINQSHQYQSMPPCTNSGHQVNF
ncbi:hypothetical protein V3481_017870 [Fusarium oxysporum f. sp. vasinfectum]